MSEKERRRYSAEMGRKAVTMLLALPRSGVRSGLLQAWSEPAGMRR